VLPRRCSVGSLSAAPGADAGSVARDLRLEAALRSFGSMHREDPRSITVEGDVMPWSVHYHQRLLHWTLHFEPKPSVALRLAASCQHVRRWTVPRSGYEQGRKGYRQWRSHLAKLHRQISASVLGEVGYDDNTIGRVGALLLKTGLKRDPEVQLFEDAICMVFLENELGTLAAKHDDGKMVDVLRRTWKKMSAAGRSAALALSLELPERERTLVLRATGASP